MPTTSPALDEVHVIGKTGDIIQKGKSKADPLIEEAKKYKTAEEFVEQKYDDLAGLQRDKPETAMRKVANSNISQIYGYAVEHGGDLMHRMNEQIGFFKGAYAKKKVQSVLSTLTNEYSFEREMHEQIASNLKYEQSKGKIKGETVESYTQKLKTLSLEYAKEHQKLPTYNRGQELAKEVAVSLGEWRFDDAVKALRELKSHIDKGTWDDLIKEGQQLTDIWNKAN